MKKVAYCVSKNVEFEISSVFRLSDRNFFLKFSTETRKILVKSDNTGGGGGVVLN